MIENHKLIIEAGRTEGQYWKDIWSYRGLFYFLAWRDILVRYKQTVIGIAWAVIRPFLTMIVFTIIFGKLAKLPSEGVPYPILVFAAMLPWQFFASSLSEASNSLTGNVNLISKVYFPRLIIPAGSIITSFVDFLISGTILVILMLWYQFIPGWRLITLPLFIAIAFATSMGAGLWLTALNVKYRDFRYIVPFIVQFGLYISPVGFSSTVVDDLFDIADELEENKLYKFAEQLRGAGMSMSNNIAEGSGSNSKKNFINFSILHAGLHSKMQIY